MKNYIILEHFLSKFWRYTTEEKEEIIQWEIQLFLLLQNISGVNSVASLNKPDINFVPFKRLWTNKQHPTRRPVSLQKGHTTVKQNRVGTVWMH